MVVESPHASLLRRALLCVTALSIVVGCASQAHPAHVGNVLGDNAITVGSFDFAESRLLAEMYSQALQRSGYEVHRAFGLGPREFVAPALANGLIELIPEYAGAALEFASVGERTARSDLAGTRAELATALAQAHVVALAAAPGVNANAFVVTRRIAERDHLRTLSDLARVGSKLRFGGPPECPARDSCLGGLARVYGVKFASFTRLDAGGPITHQALANGEVDVALLFTSDPAIEAQDLVELADDRQLQPPENVTPLVRSETVERWGARLVAAVDSVSRGLTTQALRDLNARVAAGESVARVAAAWLKAEGVQ
jgi:osmoprotectant transport system substrate-binding protein